MTDYLVIGPNRVCGVEPAGTLTDEDLAVDGVSVDHLIACGQIAVSSSKRSAAATEPKE